MKDKIKSLVSSSMQKGGAKKKIENLICLTIILIITVIIINSTWNTGSEENEDDEADPKVLAQIETLASTKTDSESYELEQRLEAILKTISGVGDVKVFINYSESSSIEAMYNESVKESSTEETDTSGGVRTIQEIDTEKEVIYSEESGNKTPVTQKVTMPVIEGAIITAEGASSATVKTNIIDAVSAATGLATHKVQVFEMNK